MVPLYAVEPPPDGALEEADMEDEETPYDWYTYANAIKRLDDRSIAALRSMSLMLVEAANVGLIPCKWGGIFGQEMTVYDTASAANTNGINQLTADVEEWEPSRQADVLQDVRKANAEILARISNRKEGKLPVTLLSGFLGSGKKSYHCK